MLPVPAWLDANQVADRLIINGLPAKVTYFLSTKPPEIITSYYQNLWQKRGNTKHKNVRLDHWHILSGLENEKLYTVQVRASNNGSSGYLAVTDLTKIGKNKTKQVPAMSGSNIANDVSSYDPGQTGRTVQLHNSFSIVSNASFYQQYYEGLGWTNDIINKSATGAVLVFRKHNEAAHIVVSSLNGTTHVVHQLVSMK